MLGETGIKRLFNMSNTKEWNHRGPKEPKGWSSSETKGKMVGLSTRASIMTLHVNGLNFPIKGRVGIMHLVKRDLITNHLQETVLNDVNRLKGGKINLC